MKTFGVDISRWQKGIDFDKIKAEGAEFVIMRCAYGTSTDACFSDFYLKAKDRGLNIGAYIYTLATRPEEAEAEAKHVCELLKGKQFELPIYFDIEDAKQKKLSKAENTAICKAFCDYMEKQGYWVGIYASRFFFSSYLNDAELQKYAHWVAEWKKECTYKGNAGVLGMWQFGGETNLLRTNKVAGFTCDQNYMLVDYPTKIKNAKKNGFGSTIVKPSVATSKPVSTPAVNLTGKTVKIKSGATYGGLTSARGKSIPSQYVGKAFKVSKMGTHKGVEEALLVGLNSWVAVASLTETGETVKSFKAGDKVRVLTGARWANGKVIVPWVFKTYPFYVRSAEDKNGNHSISIYKSGAITGVINKKYLNKV